MARNKLKCVADSRGYATSYLYDALGNRTKMTFQKGTPDEHVTSYAYDPDNRLVSIAGNSGVFTYAYDTLGRRTGLTYPNQITAGYAYDNASRLTTISHAIGATTIASYAYTLDKVGNRLTKGGTVNESYLYDPTYRLTQTNTAKNPEKYSYDPVGNRLTGPGSKDTTHAYNAGNQLTGDTIFGYGYDNNGNQTARTVATAPDKSWTYIWDYENRLIEMDRAKGTTEKQTVTFSYDPLGRRIGKTITATKNGTSPTTTYAYVYDNDNIIMETLTTASGATKTFYTQGANTDEHLALARNGQNWFYHADGLGSTTAITDQNANIVQTYTYDSFGTVKTTSSFANSYTYTAREWDRETGLYYYRARYYDPMEGRFISRDPIGFRGGINVFAYTKNNPINYADPTGLLAFTSPDAYLQSCWKFPNGNDRCTCLCQIAPDFDGCLQKCNDCFSDKKPLSARAACMCACKSSGKDSKTCECACKALPGG